MKNEDLLPPIIKDLIDALRKDENSISTRDHVCARLENVVACSNDAIEVFRQKQVRHYTKKAKQKA